MVRTIEERLNEFERTRLEARKARGHWGWWKKLGRGKDESRHSTALSFRGSSWLEKLRRTKRVRTNSFRG